MIAYLSERVLSQTIRELEGFGAEVTTEEIQVLMDRYCQKLFDQLRHYGIYVAGMIDERQGTAEFELRLSPDVERETIIEGLQLLRPICVTVSVGDIPALIQNPLFVGAFQSGWSAVAYDLERIQPSEIIDKIESLAGRFVNGGATVQAALDYDSWALSHGVPNLPSNYEQAQEYRRTEEENYRKSGGDTSSRFHVRLPDGSWA